MKVQVNDFVKRQTKSSGKAYSQELSFDFFAKYAQKKLIKNEFIEGYRPEVRIVKLENKYVHKVFCPYVRITKETRLSAKVVKRREDEDFYIQIRAMNGNLVGSGSVDLILYRNDILLENNENTTNADWELVSINAFPKGVKSMPMGPITMMRNQLELNGGTKAEYSSDEWAKSVQFWQTYAPIEPREIKIEK